MKYLFTLMIALSLVGTVSFADNSTKIEDAVKAAKTQFQSDDPTTAATVTDVKAVENGSEIDVTFSLPNNKTQMYMCSSMNMGGQDMMMCSAM
jgi:hypothetical protein